MESSAASAHVRKRENLRLSKIRREDGLISAGEHAEYCRIFTDWHARAVSLDGVLRQYLEMIEDRVLALRRDEVLESLRTSLLTLAPRCRATRVDELAG